MEKLHINITNQDLSEIRKKSLIKIKNCGLFDEFIEQNKISDEEIILNASKFIRVINENTNCLNCKGLKNCPRNVKGINFSLGIDGNGDIELVLNPCLENLKKIKLDEKFIYREFDDNNLDYNLKDTLNPDYADSRKLLVSELSNIIKNNKDIGVYLYGSRQCGKTFIMSVFSKVLVDKKDISVAFIDTSSRIRALNDLYFTNKDEFDNELNKLMRVELLILDDFGNEYKNEIIRDNIIYPLLNERFKNKLLTCFTSSYSINEIKKMYSLKEINSPKSNQLVELLRLISKEIKIESLPYRE